VNDVIERPGEDGGIVIMPAGQGKSVLRRYGEQTVIKVAEAETRGAYAVRENSIPAGFDGVPFHIHLEAEEAFYILEGELTIYIPDRRLAAAAGSFVLIPRGVVHSIGNRTPTPVRFLTIISPAWVSAWIEEESELLQSSSAGDLDRWSAIATKYGLELVGPPPVQD
jgi:mannose-6-phosphate isomerase-like protein (cupin superfamily)